MGFEGDDFLNCVVWIKTSLSASHVLKKILEIEKIMGRERKEVDGYSSRTLDIDLLFYGDQVIEKQNLTVPHPGIPERKFVLQPMAEVNGSFIHPVFQKNMVWLLAKTKDEARIQKIAKWLRNPIHDFDRGQYNYIAIEGNIGAGKTSLATQMAADFNAKLILERFMENPFLPKFYEEPHRYAFPLEMSFLADRYQQLVEDITQFDLFKECVVADYDVFKSMIFAKITLTEEEYTLYKKLFHLMHKELPRPDLYVYLYQNTDRLLENIQKRGRKFERNIEGTYLKQINDGYLEFIKNQHLETIKMIDITGMDFVKHRSDYVKVLREILS